MGIRLRVVMPWDRSLDRRSHQERYPVHSRVDELESIHERMQGGKRTDVDSPEVLGVTPIGFNGPLLDFGEGHS
jgi:hypothetical protein